MPSFSSAPTPGLRRRVRASVGGLFVRVLLSLVGVSVVLAVALTIVLTDTASSNLRNQAGAAKLAAARTLAHSATTWLQDRELQAHSLAAELTREAGDPQTLPPHLTRFTDFSSAWLYHDSGAIARTGSSASAPVAVAGRPWFTSAANDGLGVSPIAERDARPVVYLAVAVTGSRRVLVLATPTASLSSLVAGVSPGATGEALFVDASHRLVASSHSGEEPLHTRVSTLAAMRGLAGETGSLVYTDYLGHQVIGGYAPVPALHWGVIIKQNTSVAFAAVHRQRTIALFLILAGLATSLIAAFIVARALSRPLGELERTAGAVTAGDLSARVEPGGTTENRRLGESFNAMIANLESLLSTTRDAGEEMTSSSAELSAAAEQLATATNEQSSASAETSATMEELARSSAAIADHADGVAERCVETQDTLREAEAGMRTSSERTMALAKHVDEISQILELINSIADKTAVLSLNAAIEAARAGESGAGFTVVSEEVGRLAERSKSSASHIAEIVRGAQQDAGATVMAMDAGGKQMRRGLELMEQVTTASSQVQLTTQQQRTATVQVVDTMAQLAESTRQTSATTQQIAESAANLSGLAGDLHRASARARRTDFDAPSHPAAAPEVRARPTLDRSRLGTQAANGTRPAEPGWSVDDRPTALAGDSNGGGPRS